MDQPETPRASTPTPPVPSPAAAPVPAAVGGALQPGAQPVGSGIAMKRRHPVATWLLWPLLTLGIYHLVWYFKIHKEMAEFDRRRAVPVAGPMLVLLFLSWTVIAPLVSYYNCGTRIRNAQRAAGLQATCSPGIGVLLVFAFGAQTLYFQMELNKIVDAYGTPEGEQVPLWV